MFTLPALILMSIVCAIMFVAGPFAALAVVLGAFIGLVRKHLWNLTRSSIAVAVIVFICGMLWVADVPAFFAPLATASGIGMLIIIPAQFISSMFLLITLTVQMFRQTKRGPLITTLAVAQLVTTALFAFGFLSEIQRHESIEITDSATMVPQELKFVQAARPLRQN